MKIQHIIRFFQGWVHPLCQFLNLVSSVILFLMMLLTITDVILRKTVSQSILGTVEVTEFMLVIMVFFSLANMEVRNGHVKVDLVVSRFKEKAQGVVDMFTQMICFILVIMITWSTMIYAGGMRESAEVSQDLWIPIYIFVYLVALGGAALALTLFIKIFLALEKVLKS